MCACVQVFQQALHRQPNTAAQYLQQMYAAQQQHLMLQTAALQQQHSLSTAQLQSLAAVQQVSQLCSALMLEVELPLLKVCKCLIPLSPSPRDRPASQPAGKALHKTALHRSKRGPLRLR